MCCEHLLSDLLDGDLRQLPRAIQHDLFVITAKCQLRKRKFVDNHLLPHEDDTVAADVHLLADNERWSALFRLRVLTASMALSMSDAVF
jgi:hypothetical protein